jgi:hypothetical protein
LVCSAAPQEPQFEAPVRLKAGASFVR